MSYRHDDRGFDRNRKRRNYYREGKKTWNFLILLFRTRRRRWEESKSYLGREEGSEEGCFEVDL